jgi:hypothetical protein
MLMNEQHQYGWKREECRKVIASTNEYVTDIFGEWFNGDGDKDKFPKDKIVPKIPYDLVDEYLNQDAKNEIVMVEFDVMSGRRNIDRPTYTAKSTDTNELLVEMCNDENTFTERQLEMVFCLGVLNQNNITMEQLHKQTPDLKDKFELAKRFVIENS